MLNRETIAIVRNYLYLHGMTQKDLAEKLEVSYAYLRRIMAGLEGNKRIEGLIKEMVGLGEPNND